MEHRPPGRCGVWYMYHVCIDNKSQNHNRAFIPETNYCLYFLEAFSVLVRLFGGVKMAKMGVNLVNITFVLFLIQRPPLSRHASGVSQCNTAFGGRKLGLASGLFVENYSTNRSVSQEFDVCIYLT